MKLPTKTYRVVYLVGEIKQAMRVQGQDEESAAAAATYAINVIHVSAPHTQIVSVKELPETQA